MAPIACIKQPAAGPPYGVHWAQGEGQGSRSASPQLSSHHASGTVSLGIRLKGSHHGGDEVLGHGICACSELGDKIIEVAGAEWQVISLA